MSIPYGRPRNNMLSESGFALFISSSTRVTELFKQSVYEAKRGVDAWKLIRETCHLHGFVERRKAEVRPGRGPGFLTLLV